MGIFDSETVTVDTSQPYLLPSAQQQYYDPAVELTARNLLASYFGTPDQPGLISQQIPVPIQEVAGLSPLEIQARNLAGGLGAFGGRGSRGPRARVGRRVSRGFRRGPASRGWRRRRAILRSGRGGTQGGRGPSSSGGRRGAPGSVGP